MVKVLDLEIPGPLTELFAKYVGIHTGPTGPELAQLLQSKRRVRRPAFRKQRVNPHYYKVAVYIADRIMPNATSKARATFIRQEIQRIKDGIFIPDYWIQLTDYDVQNITSTATSVPDPAPPPYPYRIPTNLPTIPTYHPGTKTNSPLSTFGATQGNYWEDDTWTYRRHTLTTCYCCPQNKQPPIVMQLRGNMEAFADARPSRPMFSILANAAFHDRTLFNWDNLDPPSRPYMSAYWRFRAPPTPPPYYAGTILKVARKVITRAATHAPAQQANIIQIKIGPRPMLGRGFNNNTQIQTNWTPEIELFQVRPDLGQPPGTLKTIRLYGSQSPEFWLNKAFSYSETRDKWPLAAAAKVIAQKQQQYNPWQWWSIGPPYNNAIATPLGVPYGLYDIPGPMVEYYDTISTCPPTGSYWRRPITAGLPYNIADGSPAALFTDFPIETFTP